MEGVLVSMGYHRMMSAPTASGARVTRSHGCVPLVPKFIRIDKDITTSTALQRTNHATMPPAEAITTAPSLMRQIQRRHLV